MFYTVCTQKKELSIYLIYSCIFSDLMALANSWTNDGLYSSLLSSAILWPHNVPIIELIAFIQSGILTAADTEPNFNLFRLSLYR